MSVFKCGGDGNDECRKDATTANYYQWGTRPISVTSLFCDKHASYWKENSQNYQSDRYEPLLIPTLTSDVTIAIEIALYTLAGQGREWVWRYAYDFPQSAQAKAMTAEARETLARIVEGMERAA